MHDSDQSLDLVVGSFSEALTEFPNGEEALVAVYDLKEVVKVTAHTEIKTVKVKNE